MRRDFGGSAFTQVLTILTGTASAQVITAVAMVPLARIYGPTAFGQFAIIQSIVLLGATLAALRYDMAILLPDNHLAARVVHRLASRSILFFSAAMSIGLLLGSPFIARHYDNASFAAWGILAGAIVYCMSQISNVQFWLTRHERYSTIAGNRVAQAVLVALAQMSLAPLTSDFRGLVGGLLVGQTIALVLVVTRVPELLRRIPKGGPTVREVAVRYRKMPLLNGPNALVDGLQTSGIHVLLGNIAVNGLGQFALAYRLTQAPVSLLVGSVAQVFLQRLSTASPGEVLPLIRWVLLRLILVITPPFVILYFTAPVLIPLVFGIEWGQSGLIAQALVPWLLMMTLTAPVSTLFVVVERQELPLIFSALTTAAVLGFLGFTSRSIVDSVRVLSLIMAAFLCIWLAVALLVAWDFDKRGPRVGQGVFSN